MLCHQIHTSPTPTSRKSLTKRNTIHKAASPRYALASPYSTQPTESTHTDQDLFHSPANYESPTPESTRSFHTLPTTSCNCRTSTDHIVTDFHDKPSTKKIQDSSGFDLSQEIGLQKLPPIITKSKNSTTPSLPQKKDESCSDQKSVSVKESISKKETPARKPVSRMKMRSNAKKRNFSENCVIVKSSFDPQKDLKESMVEMIVDNNIWESKDLEKLLAWYLSLNSDEYHDMIITAFEQIWLTFEFAV